MRDSNAQKVCTVAFVCGAVHSTPVARSVELRIVKS